MSEPIVAFLPAGMDACALFRMFIPHLNTPNSRFVFRPGSMPLEHFVEAQVVVVQRLATLNNYIALEEMKKYGIKLIYDIDDNLWSIPAINPHAKRLKPHEEGFGKCASMCDLVTVSTRGLKSAMLTQWRGLIREVQVIPNALDFRLFHAPVRRDDGRVVIGWAGSNTHDHDIEEAWAVLPEVICENENVYLEVVGGAGAPRGLENHPRVKVRPWVLVGEYHARLSSWAWDIALAPLEDNRFNMSKSNLKVLEAAAVNAACLASPVQPYVEFFALAHNDWPLCVSRQQWKQKLTELVRSESLRIEMQTLVRKTAEEYFSIDKIKENWKHAVRTVMS